MLETLVQSVIHVLQTVFSKEIVVFIISMLPILELRGGVLAGYFMDLPVWSTSLISVVGNLLPIPFILMFIERIFTFLLSHHWGEKLVHKIKDRALTKSDSIQKAEFWGLLIFVAIPLPGTGAWTGALVAEMLQIDRKKAFIAIALGVVGALVIMLTLSYGVLNQLGF